MKNKYINPELEVIKLDEKNDLIMTSGENPTIPDAGSESGENNPVV